ncbi:CPBP family intramembrane metalloprotease [Staphylococcus pseudintermedius]|nr:CPBP family intramembrane metalloprotease [Staphylococcus pseudintermedius]
MLTVLKYKVYASCIYFIVLAQNLLMIPYYLLDEKPVNIASIDTDNYFKNPFLMIVCIIVTPVLEELLFRKYLWSVLIKVFNEKVYSAFYLRVCSDFTFQSIYIAINC